jgi:hypothetical protein
VSLGTECVLREFDNLDHEYSCLTAGHSLHTAALSTEYDDVVCTQSNNHIPDDASEKVTKRQQRYKRVHVLEESKMIHGHFGRLQYKKRNLSREDQNDALRQGLPRKPYARGAHI